MGYQTDLKGQFDLDKPLTPFHKLYLEKFAGTRRMQRDADTCALLDDPVRESVGLPVGPQGAYFIGGAGMAGQNRDASIKDYNNAPGGKQYDTVNGAWTKIKRPEWSQPGLWCQWVPNEDGTAILWDGKEKFYEYVARIDYRIKNFLGPWGYTLNGEVDWDGEETGDNGVIHIQDNKVEAIEDSGCCR